MRGRIVLSAIIAAAGLGAFTAAPALADDTDAVFINAIQSKGIPISTSDDAIALAQAVCEYVRAGQSADQVAQEISGPTNWSVEQSSVFVTAATQSYCPS